MESTKVNKVKNKCMTSTVFISSLRCLVLLGLFFTNLANAAAVCSAGALAGTSPADACQKHAASSFDQYASIMTYVAQASLTNCAVTYTQKSSGVVTVENSPISCTCATTPVNRNTFIHFTGPASDPTSVPTTPPPLPNQCNQNCIENYSPSLTDKFAGGDGSGNGLNCVRMNANDLSANCALFWQPTGATCFPPPPVNCTAPQVRNANNQCETPACPAGQQRETSLGACKPIVCYAPLVKVGDICKIPECPTGSTYEYKDGAGSCIKNAPLCSPPLVNINGVCVTPKCATGQVLDSATGVCKPDPANNSNTGSGSGTGTGTGTGTGSGGTGAGGAGSPTGSTGTNTGGSGLCVTPPCGKCDPSKETCGNTFGGSCKSDFQCNGDAIQCAVATATNKAECLQQALRVDTEKDPAYAKGKAIIERVGEFGEADGYKKETVSLAQVDTSNPYSSSCPSDALLFAYKGTQYMMPWSKYCNIFQIMGSIMVTCSLLTAALLLSKGNY